MPLAGAQYFKLAEEVVILLVDALQQPDADLDKRLTRSRFRIAHRVTHGKLLSGTADIIVALGVVRLFPRGVKTMSLVGDALYNTRPIEADAPI